MEGQPLDRSEVLPPRNGLTGPAKALLILESIGLAFLAFWMAEEYQNNIYLRQYVRNTAGTYLPVIAFAATFTVAIGVSEAYAHLRSSKRVEPVPIEASGGQGSSLTGGIVTASSASGEGSPPGSDGKEPGNASVLSNLSATFADVFSDSRPPAVLRHVEPSESIQVYTPPLFPVIRRLTPAREPVVEETHKPSPRPLNRVGAPPGYSLLPPPAIRQIGTRMADDRDVQDSPVETSVEEAAPARLGEPVSPKEPTRSARPRVAKKKSEVSNDLSNDLSG